MFRMLNFSVLSVAAASLTPALALATAGSVFSLPSSQWGHSYGDDLYTSFSSHYLLRFAKLEPAAIAPPHLQDVAHSLIQGMLRSVSVLGGADLHERLRTNGDIPGLKATPLEDGRRDSFPEPGLGSLFYVTRDAVGDVVQIYLDVDYAAEAGISLSGLGVRRNDDQEWVCFFKGERAGQCSFRYDGD